MEKLLIMQNELLNFVTDMMKKQELSEMEAYYVMQGVEQKIAHMALTRSAYNNTTAIVKGVSENGREDNNCQN